MECDGCTMCCYLCAVEEYSSPIAEWCKHCNPGVGCRIHGKRDKVCRDFQCAYTEMERCNDKLRPDRCKVVFSRAGEDVFFGYRHPDYELKHVAKMQIKVFNREGFSVVISDGKQKKPEIYLAQGHTPKYVLDIIDKWRRM